MRLQEYLALAGIIIVLFLASIVKADISYHLQANLLEHNIMTIDQEPHYYDMFNIYADGETTVTFLNYDANLSSSNPGYSYNDPYLYLYTIEEQTFNGIESFNNVYTLIAEDDDGNQNSPEGLYFYLADLTFTNNLIAVITSYDPYVTGTVDFDIISNKDLVIAQIPEPAAIGFICVGGGILLLINRHLKNKALS